MFSVLENFDVGFATNLFVPVDSFNKSDTIKYEIHGLENLPNIPEQNMDVCKKKHPCFREDQEHGFSLLGSYCVVG